MFCIKCGKEIKDTDKFCPFCGSSCVQPNEADAKPTETEVKPIKNPKGKKGLLIGGIIGGIVLVAGIIIGVIAFANSDNDAAVNHDGKSDVSVRDDSVSGNSVSGNTGYGNAAGEETPLYYISDVPVIDIHALNYTPATRTEGMTWDSTLFYWLEDVSASNTADGYINNCVVYKTYMRDADTGNLLQYEVYANAENGQIYKIVSIEQLESTLRIIDYYYDDGKPNFIFLREDSVYTPTYATIGKVGNRYYFNDDVMVRWRNILTPNVITEYTLTASDATYVQAVYSSLSAEEQNAYNITENQMLNAAYNTYNAILSAKGVGMVEGRLVDTTGTPLGDMKVKIYRKADDVLLYETVTGADGYFKMFTYLDNSECYLVVDETDVFKTHVIYHVYLYNGSYGYSCNDVVMHKINGDEYPVYVDLYSALEVGKGETGSVTGALLQGATVSVREGSNAYEGDVIKVLEADATGRLFANLPSGIYTAQVQMAGYADSFLEIKVNEQETTVNGFLLPLPNQGETGVVMTWSGADVDLDLTLFTPYQSTGGDMAHIGGNVANDAYGNRLVSDNNAYCEVMYVNTAQMGNYKLFVNNYTDSLAGNYSSSVLATINVYVYIYDCNGFVTVYTFPLNQSGVVWEVVEINGTILTPVHRVYEQVAGKQWWVESKEAGRLVQEINYFLPDGEWNVHSSTEYFYDDTGRVLYKIVNYGDGYYDEIYYSYDSQGRIETETINTYGFNNVSENIQYYYYDDQGKLIYIDVYWGGGAECNRRIEYSYDNLGRVSSIGRYFLNPLGEWDQAGSGGDWYEYDDNGNLSIEYCDGQINIYHFYDSKGNILMSIEVSDDEYDYITGYTEYIYENASGNRVTIDNWQSAYLDIVLEWEVKKVRDNLFDGVYYKLIYLNEDKIPELVVQNGMDVIYIYSYHNNSIQLIEDFEIGMHAYISYIPYMGIVCEGRTGGAGETYEQYFRLNNLFSLDVDHQVEIVWPEAGTEIIYLDGVVVSSEEYNALYDGYSFEGL